MRKSLDFGTESISWSGNLSKKVAVALKEWIPNVLQSTESYVSSEDIDKGSRWSIDIAKELVDSSKSKLKKESILSCNVYQYYPF